MQAEEFVKDMSDIFDQKAAEFEAKQQASGAWTNEADRWYEGDPNLVTSYCLLALQYCHPDKDK